MQRANHLYSKICTHENLRLAFRKAAKGKQGHADVLCFRQYFDANMHDIQEQLLSGRMDIGHYHFFTVRDPKVRTICAASFPERVLHHAVMNLCEPRLDAYAIFDTYACRKGKGNRKALHRAGEFARNHIWYLKLDIRKYFDSIDHEIALGLLARLFKEKPLLTLFADILRSYQVSPGKGVPIGNLISQHLANFYLGPFDHWIKETRKIKGYVRYMDDFLLFAHDKKQLALELEEIARFLETRLALQLKENIQLNRTEFGVPFLGFRIFPAHIRLLARTRQRFSEKLREYEKKYLEGTWTEPELVRHVQPLVAFTDAGDSVPFRRMVVQRFGVLS
jgi:RNA-directed DNA polymerase